ncbi:MAG TPA: TolC family protein [Syntrophales bacterium]|nr:TolC family protein [Syntrophales bacterium]HRT61664.1 TolC family protein [Syntrophales bacterium]
MKHSARLRMKQAEVEIAEASYQHSLSSLYPGFSLNSRLERFETLTKNGEVQTIYGQVIGGNVDEWRSSVYLLGEYLLSNWYKKGYQSKYYRGLVDAAGFDVEMEAKKLVLELTASYGTVSECFIKVRYEGEIVRKLQEAVALRQRAYESGEISYEEFLKSEAGLAAAEKEQSADRMQLKQSLARLSALTGKEYSESIHVEPIPPESLSYSGEIMKDVENMPEYRYRQKEKEALQHRATAARNDFFPDIGIYGRYDFYGNKRELSGAFKDMEEISYNAGFFLSIPLFDGFARKWERQKVLREIKRQEASIQSLKADKSKELEALHAGLSEQGRTVEHYRKLAARYRQVIEIARGAKRLGERSVMDIAETEKESLSIERDLKVAENAMALTEKKLLIESNYRNFMRDYYGNGSDRR